MEVHVNKLTALALGFATVLITGCAASSGPGDEFWDELQPSEFDYSPPEASPEVENTIEVNDSPEVVWDRIINSAPDGLNVESADKESGLITLSYSTDDPTQYVDCGRSQHTFDFRDEFEEYDYPAAADVTFKEKTYWKDGSDYKPAVQEITRSNVLEGVVEVSVTPQEDTTSLKVEAVYDLTMFLNRRYKLYSSMDGENDDRSKAMGWDGHALPRIEYPSFATGESATETFFEESAEPLTTSCIPKGTLEAQILEMAER